MRVLRVGGRTLIYVWARNQRSDNRQSSYLRQNKRNQTTAACDDDGSMIVPKKTQEYVGGLPVHTNRTQFAAQDMLVPWKLKETNVISEEGGGETTFLRFYHVFEENELEALCERVRCARVERSYYDQGNWCVILEKIKCE